VSLRVDSSSYSVRLAAVFGAIALCTLLVVPAGIASASVSAGGSHESAPVAAPWSIVSSPDPGGTGADGINSLNGIACASSTDCFAVGSYDAGSDVAGTLIESWDGSSWSVATNPDSTGGGTLDAVSCFSSTDCIAVGSVGTSTLAESWNGTEWTDVSGPNVGDDANVLTGVSCPTTSTCTAVGYTDTVEGGQPETLIEYWDGTSWTIQTSPNDASGNNTLAGVSCAAATACEAVGTFSSSAGNQTLVESWDSTAWTLTASPDAGSGNNELFGVSCPTSTSCTAVGAEGFESLIESWNGTAWTVVKHPKTKGTEAEAFYGVSCTSSTNCVAAGGSVDGSGLGFSTFVETYSGTAWSVTSSPTPNDEDGGQLAAVTCTTLPVCIGAGSGYYNDAGNKTLIETGNADLPSITKFSPVSGPVGASVSITGINLEEASSVTFACRCQVGSHRGDDARRNGDFDDRLRRYVTRERP
jgi:hypothetical protein